jgi:enoyl-CoA hydratase/carnithine racemase
MPRYQHWLVGTENQVTTLTLNRPEVNNSLTLETLAELRAVAADLAADRDCRVVIVQGRGEHFSVGMEIPVIQWIASRPEPLYRNTLLEMQLALDEFEALEKPAIAKVHGFCISAGLLLALCCDLRVASERAVFSLPEVKLGLGVVMGTQRVVRAAGLAAAQELILLGERFDARDALRYGIVHRVVPADQLDATASLLAGKFLRLPPRTVGMSKRLIRRGYPLSLRESQDLEIDAQAELLGSTDFKEALASFVEKRPPRFSGE